MNDRTSEQLPQSVVNEVIVKGSVSNYIQLLRTKITFDLKATVLKSFLELKAEMFSNFFTFYLSSWEVTWSWNKQALSPHALEIIDHNRPLLAEHKSRDWLVSHTHIHTFDIRVITPYNPQALLGLVSSRWLPLHLVYPVLTQTSSYVASPFPQRRIHITETAAAMEGLFPLLQPRSAKIYSTLQPKCNFHHVGFWEWGEWGRFFFGALRVMSTQLG